MAVDIVLPSDSQLLPVGRVELIQQASGEVNIRMEGTVSVQLRASPTTAHVHEEVGVYDGWSDEEERVFMDEEVDRHSESSSSEEEEVEQRRFRARRRWCLFGCDCEKDRGRKCLCERRGSGLCSEHCGCDKIKCRAIAVS